MMSGDKIVGSGKRKSTPTATHTHTHTHTHLSVCVDDVAVEAEEERVVEQLRAPVRRQPVQHRKPVAVRQCRVCTRRRVVVRMTAGVGGRGFRA